MTVCLKLDFRRKKKKKKKEDSHLTWNKDKAKDFILPTLKGISWPSHWCSHLTSVWFVLKVWLQGFHCFWEWTLDSSHKNCLDLVKIKKINNNLKNSLNSLEVLEFFSYILQRLCLLHIRPCCFSQLTSTRQLWSHQSKQEKSSPQLWRSSRTCWAPSCSRSLSPLRLQLFPRHIPTAQTSKT